MPITHSTAGVADTFAYKQALELGTGVNVAKKSGFKSWLTHLRLHRALVVAKESELTRELRQMRQAHRRETRFNPQSTVGILDDTHLPTLVATEGARKASEELRKELHITYDPIVESPPMTRRSVGTAEIPRLDTELVADCITRSTFASLTNTSLDLQFSAGSSELAVEKTPRLVKCTPRRRCFRKPQAARPVRPTTIVLQCGDISSSMEPESSLLAYASTMSEGWDTTSFLADAPLPVRAPTSPCSRRMSPRRFKQREGTLVQTVATEDAPAHVSRLEPQTLCKAVLERVYRRSWKKSLHRQCQDEVADSRRPRDRKSDRVEEEAAARAIQKHFRSLKMSKPVGVTEDKRVKSRMQEHSGSSEMSGAHEVIDKGRAAATIQRHYRAYKMWEVPELTEEEMAIVTIQKVYKSLRMSRTREIIEEEAATTIQNHYRSSRMSKAREVDEKEKAATIIQKRYRSLRMSKAREVDEEERAATIIQKRYRSLRMSRARDVSEQERAATTIQRHYRSLKMSEAHEVTHVC